MTPRISGKMRLLLATALFSTLTINAQAQPPFPRGNPNSGAIVGGVLGIIGEMARQQQQQQLLQQQQQQQQLFQQQAIQRQQQIEADRQRAAAAAQSEAAQRQADIQAANQQRQQAAAAQKQREQQAAAKAAVDAKAKADTEEKLHLDAGNKLRADPVFATILGTDGQDITVLIVGTDTPNVIRNLKGEPVFQNSATACLPFGINGLKPAVPDECKTADRAEGRFGKLVAAPDFLQPRGPCWV
jgi:multidrug efflux pump subunit AcrA (membrane-fusion protein)